MRSGLIWKVMVCLLVSGIYAQPISAHPHYWINLKADMILDGQNRMTGIRQHWTFDVYFSMMTIADVMNEHGDMEVGLEKMADQMMGNLEKYQYFSVLTVDGKNVVLPPPSSYRLTENTQQQPSVLELEMHFDFGSPLVVKEKDLVWSVFDPTYYIAMSYLELENVAIKSDKAVPCKLNLNIPNPSRELVEYAQNLDRTQKDSDGLGKSFAEKVLINCH